jgi:signal transduction histidine kinase
MVQMSGNAEKAPHVTGMGRFRPSPRVWRIAIAIIAAQLIYWFGIRPVLIVAPQKPVTYETFNPRSATLQAPTLAALAGADFQPAELPWSDCCRGYRAFSVDWNLVTVPPEGLGIVPTVDADNTMVIVNGQLAFVQGRMDVADVTHHELRTVVFVSPGLLRPGTNRLDFIMVRAGLPYFDVIRPPYIGDYAAMVDAYGRRMFIFNEYGVITYTIGFVLAAIALLVLIRSDRKSFAFWVFALALSWSLLTHYYSWKDPPFGADARLIYYFALTNFVPVAWLNLANAWSERPMRWIGIGSLAGYAAIMAVTVNALLRWPIPDGFDHAGELADYFGAALSIAAILRFLWHLVHSRDDRVAEVGVFALCISLIGLDRYAELVSHTAAGNMALTLPLLLLALAVAYLGRNIRLFQSLSAFNAELSAKVDAREAELSASHRRENELVRRQAHDAERQRIMRDVHDGLGSNLMSMLLAARRGMMTSERMVDGIQSVIDEMRLMLESMDSVGESLPSALATFRQRIESRLRDAGFALTWSDTASNPYPQYGPRSVLHVFRILQEAVANALKHSGGTQIAVSIGNAPDPAFVIRLVVLDDGRGMVQSPGNGSGLGNMSTRAAALGARLKVENAPSGTRIVLDLPAEGPTRQGGRLLP